FRSPASAGPEWAGTTPTSPWGLGRSAATRCGSPETPRPRGTCFPYGRGSSPTKRPPGWPPAPAASASSTAGTWPATCTAAGVHLYGDNVLVPPITSPNDGNGNASATLWVAPGTWSDCFTGHVYSGPSTVTIADPLSRMPVLVKAGGIVPTRTDYVDNQAQR